MSNTDSQDWISDLDLLQDLKRVWEELDEKPTQSQYQDIGKYSARTLGNRFGSWNDALISAGIEPTPAGRHNKIDKEKLLDDLGRVASDIDETPTRKQYDSRGEYYSGTIVDRFGSWAGACEEAGFEPNMRANPFDKELAIKDIQRVAEIVNGPPTCHEYNEHGEWHSSTISSNFGSWTNAVEESGFEPVGSGRQKNENGEIVDIRGGGSGNVENLNPKEPVSDDDLLEDLAQVANELGYPPTRKQYSKIGEHHGATFTKRFGSWDKAMEKIGIDYTPGEIHDRRLIHDIIEVAEEIGKAPNQTQYKEVGEHSPTTISQRFGSWNEAIRLAGLKPQNPSDIDLLEDLADVAHVVEGPPTKEEYDRYGHVEYSSDLVADHLPGSWSVLSHEAWQMASELDD